MKRSRSWVPGVLLLMGLGWLVNLPVLGATYYVSKAGTNTNNGQSPSTAWGTIQYAVTNAGLASNDVILVGEGQYTEAVSWPQSAMRSVTLKGGHDTNDWSWAPATHPSMIKPASSASDVLLLSATQATVRAFVLTGGRYGVWARYDPTNTKTIAECVISNNTSHGVYVSNVAVIQAQNCLVANNGVNGFYLDTSTWVGGTQSAVLNCTIVGNGGDGWEDQAQYSCGHSVRNCLITGNQGYGIYIRGSYYGLISVSENCLYGNIKGEFWFSAWNYLVQQGLIISGYPYVAGSGDYHLTADSPCIDVGTNLTAAGVTTDLEGNPRSAPFDIGCYESGYTAAPKFMDTYVDPTRPDDAGVGTNAATAKKMISAAAAVTAAGGICHVPAGTFAGSVLMGQSGITLEGAGMESTIVTGGVRVAVWMAGTNQTVRGLTAAYSEAGIAAAGPATLSNLVEQCSVRNCTYGIYGVQNRLVTTGNTSISRLFTVRRCAVSNNVDGLRADGSSSVYADNVLAAGNSGCGISVGYTAYANRAYNCTLVSNGLDGVSAGGGGLGGHNGFTVINCIVNGNGRCGVANYRTHSAVKLNISYCDVTANLTNLYYGVNCLVLGGGMLDIDPVYVGGGDCHLATGSPCTDAGTNLTAFGITNDLDGVARTNTLDLGCYESSFGALAKWGDTYVDATRPNDSGMGTNWATAKKTINTAFSITAESGTCHAAAGTYTGPFTVPANVTLEGTDRSTVILSGGNPVVKFVEAGGVVREVTIQGGTIGVETTVGGARRIERCVVRNNSTYGIKHGKGDLMVTRCWVTNNVNDGLYFGNVSDSSLTNVSSLFAGNGGDGVSAQLGVHFNCTFAGNGGDGLNMNSKYAAHMVRNCVFAGNTGYGVRNEDPDYYPPDIISIYNSCSYGNTLGTFRASGGPNVRWISGNHAGNPQFAGAGDYHLTDGSMCAGAGSDMTALGVTNDLDGVVWTVPFDMGCYEATFARPVSVSNTFVDAAAVTDTASGTNAAAPKKTIGSALAITAAGGTCTVAAGLYRETIMLPANVTVVGAGQEVTIVSNNADGVYWAVTNGTIRNLTLCGGLRGVEFYSTGGGLIEDCTIRHTVNGFWARSSFSSGQTQVSRCSVVSNSSCGIWLYGNVTDGYNGVRVDAVNTLFADNGSHGVYLYLNTKTQTFRNCTIGGNRNDGYYEYSLLGATDGLTAFTNCIVGDNGRYGVWFDSTTTTTNRMAYSCVGGNLTNDFAGAGAILFGTGMITNVSPQFDPYSCYRLMRASPCVDTGVDIGVTNDLEGKDRPIWYFPGGGRSGYDMGAVEYFVPPCGTVFRMR